VSDKSQEPMSTALAALLEAKGMSQIELCRAAEVSPGAVCRYLGGSRGTRLDAKGAKSVARIASVLGVCPDYFREYRAWRLREITVASPTLMDDFYDLIVETARLQGLLKERPEDAQG
jgi:transcriptional regulator with XRE-family HTH domain